MFHSLRKRLTLVSVELGSQRSVAAARHYSTHDKHQNLLSYLLSSTEGDRVSSKLLHFASTANRVLHEVEPMQKVHIAKECFQNITQGIIPPSNDTSQLETLGDRFAQMQYPARPEKPELVDPKQISSHQKLGVALPISVLHNLAHVELNALDMCFHTILLAMCREEPIPGVHWSTMAENALSEERGFFDDFVRIAADEARHFAMYEERLLELGYGYGSLPAHKALWNTALQTKHDLRARVCLIQLVNEARGLDSGPRLTVKLTSCGDKKSCQIVDTVYREEEEHVRLGMKHFTSLCDATNVDPMTTFQRYIREHFGSLPTPFNDEARNSAGMPETWYKSLARKS